MDEKCCKTCFYAKKIYTSPDLLCEKKGIVSSDGFCKKYSYNIFEKPIPKKRSTMQYNKEKFQL